jgi:hypothetical protein
MTAEYKSNPTAMWMAGGADEHSAIVRTGSKEERELLDYGRKRLSA